MSRVGSPVADNRLVLIQEWLAEAFTMWGVAAQATVWVYRVAAALLVATSAALLIIVSFA